MNYQVHYDKLIARGQRTLIHGYRERHHIIPVCLGGSNKKENLVYLTAEEHYVAHQLLVKIYPSVYGLAQAAILMCGKIGERNNKSYAWLRKKSAEDHSVRMKGRPAHNKGKPSKNKGIKQGERGPLSEEHRKAVSESLKGKCGHKHTQETKDKLSKAAKGRKQSDEAKEKNRQSHLLINRNKV